MNIVFDMDNTLIDEMGATMRPGMRELLEELGKEHDLILWTNSGKARAVQILSHHELRPVFKRFIFREDYANDDPRALKDIRMVQGDYIIDDDPAEIKFNRKQGKFGFLITTYRKNSNVPPEELEKLKADIKRYSKGSGWRLWRKG